MARNGGDAMADPTAVLFHHGTRKRVLSHLTELEGPRRVVIIPPFLPSQNWRVGSQEAEASLEPFAGKVLQHAAPKCPVRVAT